MLRWFRECVKVVYVLRLPRWLAGLDLSCLRVCVCMCVCVSASVCVCEFVKAKSWHIAQRVGWGKNTTQIYWSLLSCRRQAAYLYVCVYVCVCICVLCLCMLMVCVFSRGSFVGCTSSLNIHTSFSITPLMMLCLLFFFTSKYDIKYTVNREQKTENSENQQKVAEWQRQKKLPSWRRCSHKADLSDVWKSFRMNNNHGILANSI